MFEYGLADWAGIYGFMIPFLTVSYIALFIAAKILSYVFQKNLKAIWQSHWLVFGISSLSALFLVFFYIKSYKPGQIAFDHLVAGVPQPEGSTFFVWHVLGISVSAIGLSLCAIDDSKKYTASKKAKNDDN